MTFSKNKLILEECMECGKPDVFRTLVGDEKVQLVFMCRPCRNARKDAMEVLNDETGGWN